MSKVHELTIKDFLDADARLDISFHFCKDLQTAYDKLKPYTSLGTIEKGSHNRTVWLKIKNEKVQITAFL